MEEKYLLLIKKVGLKEELKKLGESVFALQQSILLDEGDEKSLEEIITYLANVDIAVNELIAYYNIDYKRIADKKVYKVINTLERVQKR